MAIPVSPSFASFSVTARTEGRSVHGVLLDAMFSKSRFLEVLAPAGTTNQEQRHEWISLKAPVQTVTGVDANTTLDGSNSLQVLQLSAADVAQLRVGSLLVNQTRATPLGTYNRNELMEVVEMTSTTTVTVTRDAGNFASGTGSTAHVSTDVFHILGAATQEGSLASVDPNTYSADDIFENYTEIRTMKMQLTGSQKARRMEVQASELERQWSRELIRLKNERAGMFMYGYNSATGVGSNTVLRKCKGIIDFMVDNINAANPLIDYTSTTLGYDAINKLFIRLFNNGADTSEPYKIVTTAAVKDVISSWDADKVRTTLDNEQVGREITMFKSTVGFRAEIIADTVMQGADLVIIQPQKIQPLTFRPYDKQEWGKGTSNENGDDMWYQRTIGEETLMVQDPGFAHAAMTALTWL